MSAKRSARKPEPTRHADNNGLAHTIAWYSLLALVALVPLATSNLGLLGIPVRLTQSQFDLPKLVLLRSLGLVALASWAWHAATKERRLRISPVDLAVLAFLALVGVGTFFSVHVPSSLFGTYVHYEGLLSFVNYALIFFLVVQLVDRGWRARRVAQVLFASSVAVSLLGLAQYLGIDPVDWGPLSFEPNRAFSTYGNPGMLGGFLCFSLLVAAGLALSEDATRLRIVYWVGFFVSASALIVTFTRSSWLGALVGMAILAAYAFYSKVRLQRLDWAMIAASSAAAAVVVARSLSNANDVLNVGKRLASLPQLKEGSTLTRLQIWDAAVSAIADRPVFGFGADTFEFVFAKYKPAEYVQTAGYLRAAGDAHSFPLQLAVGIGLPAALAHYVVIGWAAVRSGRLLIERKGSKDALLMAAFWGACAAYVVHSLASVSVPGVAVFLWISMGVLLAPLARTVDLADRRYLALAAAALSALAVAGVVLQGVNVAADRAYLRSLSATGVQRTEFAESAVRLNPWRDTYRRNLAQARTEEFFAYADQVAQLEQSGQAAEAEAARASAQAAFDEAEAETKSLVAFVPAGSDNPPARLANLYVVAAQIWGEEWGRKAVESARRGVKVEPNSPQIRYVLAYTLAETNQKPEAIEQLRVAHELDPGYADASVLLAELLAEAGKRNEAIAVLERTQADSPGQQAVIRLLSQLQWAPPDTAP